VYLPQIIKTDRLVLIPFSEKTVSQKYLNWLNDKEINQYLEIKVAYTMDKLCQYVNSMIEKKIMIWEIHLNDTNEHLGNIKIDPLNISSGTGEYGILMGEKTEWGKGYAKEASLAVIDFCFNKIGLRKITLGVISENISAVNLYKSLGFELEGTFKYHGFYNGKWCSCFRMTLFNSQFSY
jgi:ribosomal-protein-alanine N-acetyltransferase